MRKIQHSIAVLVLAFVGLAGRDQEHRAVGDANPVRVAEMQQTYRISGSGTSCWFNSSDCTTRRTINKLWDSK